MYDNINTKYEDAKIYINEVNAQEVIKNLKTLATQKGLTAENYAYLSKAYIFNGNDNLALYYSLKSIEKDPEYIYGYVRAAFTYARMAERSKCIKYLKLADKLNKGLNNYINMFLVVLFKFVGDNQKYDRIFECIKHSFTKTAENYYNLGFIYSQEEPQLAIKYFLQAEKLSYKDTYNLWANLADNYSLTDNYEKAEEYADKCLSVGESRIALRIKAEALKEKEDFDNALIYLRKKYKLDKNNENKINTLTLLIYCSMYSEKPKRTEKYINFALNNFRKDYNLYYVSASYYETIEDFDRAIFLYKKMTNSDEYKETAYSSLSYCYSQKGDNESALTYVNKAIEQSPEAAYPYYRKGRILAAQKKYSEALTYFEKSIDFDRSDVDSFQWISYCYSVLKNFDKSLEYANRAILLDKDDCYSYFRKAWAYQEMGRYTEAINYYKECIVQDDRYVDAYLNISYIYSKLGDSKQSLLYANKALLINKQYAYAHYRKAWALQESGRFEEACDGYSKAIELDPTDIYNYLGIACISLNNQEDSTALLYANKALFIDRNCGGAYYYKSLALNNLGKQKEAEAAYAKALELGYTPG